MSRSLGLREDQREGEVLAARIAGLFQGLGDKRKSRLTLSDCASRARHGIRPTVAP